MADEVEVKAPEVATHGAPPVPNAEPATKAEKEAAEAAKIAEKKGLNKEGLDETHSNDEPKKEAKALTQAELDAAVEAAKAQAETWAKEYVQVDHASGQAVVNLLKEAKVSPVEANAMFEKAISSGDLTQVDWAGLEAKLGKDKMVLAKAGIQQYYNEVFAVQQKTVQEVHKIFDGEKGWNTVRDWAQKAEKSDPVYAKKVQEYRKMLEQGGFAAESAAKALRADYEASPNTKGLGNDNLLLGTTKAEVTGGPLSKKEYLDLRRKAEADGADQNAINVLMARRKAGMQAGV